MTIKAVVLFADVYSVAETHVVHEFVLEVLQQCQIEIPIGCTKPDKCTQASGFATL